MATCGDDDCEIACCISFEAEILLWWGSGDIVVGFFWIFFGGFFLGVFCREGGDDVSWVSDVGDGKRVLSEEIVIYEAGYFGVD